MLHLVGLGLQVIGAGIAVAALVIALRGTNEPLVVPKLYSPELAARLTSPFRKRGRPSFEKPLNGVTREMVDAYDQHEDLLAEVIADVDAFIESYVARVEDDRNRTRRLLLIQMVGVVVALIGTVLG